jgi:hypothetical protein
VSFCKIHGCGMVGYSSGTVPGRILKRLGAISGQRASWGLRHAAVLRVTASEASCAIGNSCSA